MSLFDEKLPSEALVALARNIRELRLNRQWTQDTLSERSGVPLSTLRKFERTGKISLESFLKVAFSLDVLDELLVATESKGQSFTSMDQVLDKVEPKKRKRGRKS
ncbi:helix-turn-helix domain-containing protein [Maridesulfovibrio ferrireducens]|uniref:helix-turn-helix domain-containing protein n=1 Tax=Maridesulfovibrio ferrireducens TaxID=246191 RepID=UPI001A258FF4|nr:helix-turn-helix transcriptional regulator [Maridesulfovibrio ferrireducens]MBI9113377.1 helix-turn-helix transcriptional regulator [Maridesulfovibrio ferrireducens]